MFEVLECAPQARISPRPVLLRHAYNELTDVLRRRRSAWAPVLAAIVLGCDEVAVPAQKRSGCGNGRNLGQLSFIIIDPAGMVPLVALRRTKKPGSARAGTCRDHAINGPRSWTTQSRGTPAIDAQRLNWLRRRRAIRSGGGAHPLAATRRLLRSVMVGA